MSARSHRSGFAPTNRGDRGKGYPQAASEPGVVHSDSAYCMNLLQAISIGALLCTASSAPLAAQTKTIDDKNCHVTVPDNWTQLGRHSAQAPGTKTFAAVVRSVTPDHYKVMLEMIKQGQMASYKPKILDENAKRVLIQTEITSPGGKTTTHYQVMTKGEPGCQGSVDFEDQSDAETGRKIVESTTGAQ